MWTFLRLALAGLALAAASPSSAAPCTADDFAKVVDDAGAKLRAFNLENAPKLQAKLRKLKEKKGWGDAEDDEMARDYLSDARLSSFDATSNELLAKLDTLGQPAPGKEPDCAKLDELKAASLELLAVMKAKSAYLIGKIDAELGGPTAPKAGETPVAAAPAPEAKPQPPAAHPSPAPPAAPAPATPPAPAQAAPKPAPPVAPKVAAAPPAPVPSPKPPAAPKAPSSPSWSTTTAQHPEATAAAPPGTPLALPPPGTFVPPEEGYTIEEIRDATRGFFGTASTNLATVLEHTFSESGRPTAYVLGQEGGGAFLAGLRYGSGTLYLRAGGTMPVYWHGPSLGYDFGAAGSRTLFLIYRLKEPADIFRHFTGVDGSAYVIGGVGMTLLTGGDVIMAPIRTGLGLRVGANIGYVRFTRAPSWNPF